MAAFQSCRLLSVAFLLAAQLSSASHVELDILGLRKKAFLSTSKFAVVGASDDETKFGTLVRR